MNGQRTAGNDRPGRAKNVYVREDQVLRHPTALAILFTGHRDARGQAQRITAPAQAAELIDYLRVTGTTLTYDPGDRTLRADTGEVVTVARHR